MRVLFATIAWLVLYSLATKAENTALIPTPRDYPTNWLAQHEANVSAARRGGIDVLFLGDSITAGWGWGTGGMAIWQRDFAPRHAANFGIGWDRIQNVLWRIENGELEGIEPRVVILLIGTNNAGNEDNGRPRNSTPEIIEGAANLIHRIEFHLPQAKIVLFAIFPRGAPADPVRTQIASVNAGLAKLAGDKVQFLDIGREFLETDGTLPRAMFPDLLHPNAQGYQIWARAIDQALANDLN